MTRSLPCLGLVGLLAIAGCTNPSDIPFARCTEATASTDCGRDFYCYRNYCIPLGGVDGGMDAPAGDDTGVDAGVPVDTGTDAGSCAGGGTSCPTSMAGNCAMGTIRCTGDGGAGVCVRNADPVPETCDDHDEDCDGAVDEDADAECFTGTTGCTRDAVSGVWTCVGVCRTGIQACDGEGHAGACEGAVVASTMPDGCSDPGSPAVDDDCDGMIDEDCACTNGATQPCYAGPMGTAGIGECMAGTITCAGGTFGDCIGEVTPVAETCGNPSADDDCNGTDDDVPGTGDPCDTGMMGVCADGVTTCVGSSIECRGPTARAERCDMLDDDCNGIVDNGFDLDTSEDHCGGCGLSCGTGRTCCGGMCVSTESDTGNCGDCGTTCEGATNACCGGDCLAPTAGACTGCGTTDCAGMGLDCCPPACVDFDSDPGNCGGCGASNPDFICGAGERCCGGSCVGDTDTTCGSCDACEGNEQCCGASGAAECVLDADPMNCRGCGVVCGAGQTCCGTGCANLMTSPANCGTCGTTCSGTQICSMGLCCPMGQFNSGGICCPTGFHNSGGICCGAGLTNCGGTCFNLQDTEAHCGSCPTVCSGLTSVCCRGGCAALCL